jgi:hypothetical protein
VATAIKRKETSPTNPYPTKIENMKCGTAKKKYVCFSANYVPTVTLHMYKCFIQDKKYEFLWYNCEKWKSLSVAEDTNKKVSHNTIVLLFQPTVTNILNTIVQINTVPVGTGFITITDPD